MLTGWTFADTNAEISLTETQAPVEKWVLQTFKMQTRGTQYFIIGLVISLVALAGFWKLYDLSKEIRELEGKGSHGDMSHNEPAALTTVAHSTPHHNNASAFQQSKNIIVKGLYIGMNGQSIVSLIQEKFGRGWRLEKLVSSSFAETVGLVNQELTLRGIRERRSVEDTIMLGFDGAKSLSFIHIPSECSAMLFQAGDISAQEFAQIFIDSYNIPEMSVTEDGWQWTSPDGVRTEIKADKTVVIKRVATEQQRKLNFN